MARLISDIIEELKAHQQSFNETLDREVLVHCIEAYCELLNDAPDNPEILFQLGTAHLQLGAFGAAMPYLRRTLCHWPNNAHVWSNLGCCLRSLHQLPEARDAFIKSLMDEEKAETYNNLASTFVNEDNPQGGIDYARKAMEMAPEDARAKWNYSLLLLEQQHYGQAFQFYDSGFFCNERTLRFYSAEQPDTVQWWDGNVDMDGALVLWDEQGIGDRLLAANLLQHLEGTKVAENLVLECHPRLEGIYRRSFPWIKHVYPTSKKTHIEWTGDHDIQAKCSVMSLAKWFWQDAANMKRNGYLKPDMERVAEYREEFENHGKGPYYALSWRGGKLKTNTGYRSLKLGWFKKAIEKIGGTFISVQYHDDSAGKVERFRAETGLPVYHCHGAQADDYDRTLAALAACDHVITACNSVVHTAGGAGIPQTVLVPKRRAWRYPAGAEFPWYADNSRMIHQDKDGNWEGVLNQLVEELHESKPGRSWAVAAGRQ